MNQSTRLKDTLNPASVTPDEAREAVHKIQDEGDLRGCPGYFLDAWQRLLDEDDEALKLGVSLMASMLAEILLVQHLKRIRRRTN